MSRSEASEQAIAAILGSWSFDPWVFGSLAVVVAFYLRGFARLRRQMPERFPAWRALAFVSGIATLAVAVASPLDALAPFLLQVHMTQHLLLTMVAPPLLWLGAPWIPLLRGLPPRFLREGLGPFLSSPELTGIARAVTHPLVGWSSFVVATWVWHLPSLYERALVTPWLHALEHGFFFGTALLFWWPVVQPWPSRARWPRWTMIPYLFLADLQNTAFSALFAMLERPIYPVYAAVPRLFGISVLDDQMVAGAIMWVPGSIAFLLPLALIVAELLEPRLARPGAAARARDLRSAFGRPQPAFDLLALPIVGPLLRSPSSRRVAQVVLFVLALAIVLDGLLGPQISSMNLAGVLPWTYWRGFVVIALLAVGNLFCMTCPFMLPRELARRLPLAHRRWPHALRSKWLAVALLAVFLWAYEALDLWDSPWWTAWIVVGYFVAAFVVDALFRGASFCKYVCPIGQFNFVQSTVSPFEVQVRDAGVCGSCATQDCLRGNEAHRGCELELYLPTKRGNLDCTFCLDCVHACPHDNVGLIAVPPGGELIADAPRSSLGWLGARPDVAALVVLLSFGAFANAAAMVEPVVAWESSLAARLGFMWPGATTTLLLFLGLIVVPAALVLGCTFAARSLSRLRTPWRELLCRFSLALVPLGFAMWLAHFVFHLLHGAGTAAPVAARALRDVGLRFAEVAHGAMLHGTAMGGGFASLGILLLDAGLLLALYLTWRVAGGYASGTQRLALAAPWILLATGLYAAGVWIAFQPMEMRGMMMPA